MDWVKDRLNEGDEMNRRNARVDSEWLEVWKNFYNACETYLRVYASADKRPLKVRISEFGPTVFSIWRYANSLPRGAPDIDRSINLSVNIAARRFDALDDDNEVFLTFDMRVNGDDHVSMYNN